MSLVSIWSDRTSGPLGICAPFGIYKPKMVVDFNRRFFGRAFMFSSENKSHFMCSETFLLVWPRLEWPPPHLIIPTADTDCVTALPQPLFIGFAPQESSDNATHASPITDYTSTSSTQIISSRYVIMDEQHIIQRYPTTVLVQRSRLSPTCTTLLSTQHSLGLQTILYFR